MVPFSKVQFALSQEFYIWLFPTVRMNAYGKKEVEARVALVTVISSIPVGECVFPILTILGSAASEVPCYKLRIYSKSFIKL